MTNDKAKLIVKSKYQKELKKATGTVKTRPSRCRLGKILSTIASEYEDELKCDRRNSTTDLLAFLVASTSAYHHTRANRFVRLPKDITEMLTSATLDSISNITVVIET